MPQNDPKKKYNNPYLDTAFQNSLGKLTDISDPEEKTVSNNRFNNPYLDKEFQNSARRLTNDLDYSLSGDDSSIGLGYDSDLIPDNVSLEGPPPEVRALLLQLATTQNPEVANDYLSSRLQIEFQEVYNDPTKIPGYYVYSPEHTDSIQENDFRLKTHTDLDYLSPIDETANRLNQADQRLNYINNYRQEDGMPEGSLSNFGASLVAGSDKYTESLNKVTEKGVNIFENFGRDNLWNNSSYSIPMLYDDVAFGYQQLIDNKKDVIDFNKTPGQNKRNDPTVAAKELDDLVFGPANIKTRDALNEISQEIYGVLYDQLYEDPMKIKDGAPDRQAEVRKKLSGQLEIKYVPVDPRSNFDSNATPGEQLLYMTSPEGRKYGQYRLKYPDGDIATLSPHTNSASTFVNTRTVLNNKITTVLKGIVGTSMKANILASDLLSNLPANAYRKNYFDFIHGDAMRMINEMQPATQVLVPGDTVTQEEKERAIARREAGYGLQTKKFKIPTFTPGMPVPTRMEEVEIPTGKISEAVRMGGRIIGRGFASKEGFVQTISPGFDSVVQFYIEGAGATKLLKPVGKLVGSLTGKTLTSKPGRAITGKLSANVDDLALKVGAQVGNGFVNLTSPILLSDSEARMNKDQILDELIKQELQKNPDADPDLIRNKLMAEEAEIMSNASNLVYASNLLQVLTFFTPWRRRIDKALMGKRFLRPLSKVGLMGLSATAEGYEEGSFASLEKYEMGVYEQDGISGLLNDELGFGRALRNVLKDYSQGDIDTWSDTALGFVLGGTTSLITDAHAYIKNGTYARHVADIANRYSLYKTDKNGLILENGKKILNSKAIYRLLFDTAEDQERRKIFEEAMESGNEIIASTLQGVGIAGEMFKEFEAGHTAKEVITALERRVNKRKAAYNALGETAAYENFEEYDKILKQNINIAYDAYQKLQGNNQFKNMTEDERSRYFKAEFKKDYVNKVEKEYNLFKITEGIKEKDGKKEVKTEEELKKDKKQDQIKDSDYKKEKDPVLRQVKIVRHTNNNVQKKILENSKNIKVVNDWIKIVDRAQTTEDLDVIGEALNDLNELWSKKKPVLKKFMTSKDKRRQLKRLKKRYDYRLKYKQDFAQAKTVSKEELKLLVDKKLRKDKSQKLTKEEQIILDANPQDVNELQAETFRKLQAYGLLNNDSKLSEEQYLGKEVEFEYKGDKYKGKIHSVNDSEVEIYNTTTRTIEAFPLGVIANDPFNFNFVKGAETVIHVGADKFLDDITRTKIRKNNTPVVEKRDKNTKELIGYEFTDVNGNKVISPVKEVKGIVVNEDAAGVHIKHKNGDVKYYMKHDIVESSVPNQSKVEQKGKTKDTESGIDPVSKLAKTEREKTNELKRVTKFSRFGDKIQAIFSFHLVNKRIGLSDNFDPLHYLVRVLNGNTLNAKVAITLNNSNHISLSRNGRPSNLFRNILSLVNHNQRDALRLKFFVYTDEFRNEFGNWTEFSKEKQDKSFVDNNGEPEILYVDTFNEDGTVSLTRTKKYETQIPVYVKGEHADTYKENHDVKVSDLITVDGRTRAEIENKKYYSVDPIPEDHGGFKVYKLNIDEFERNDLVLIEKNNKYLPAIRKGDNFYTIDLYKNGYLLNFNEVYRKVILPVRHWIGENSLYYDDFFSGLTLYKDFKGEIEQPAKEKGLTPSKTKILDGKIELEDKPDSDDNIRKNEEFIPGTRISLRDQKGNRLAVTYPNTGIAVVDEDGRTNAVNNLDPTGGLLSEEEEGNTLYVPGVTVSSKEHDRSSAHLGTIFVNQGVVQRTLDQLPENSIHFTSSSRLNSGSTVYFRIPENVDEAIMPNGLTWKEYKERHNIRTQEDIANNIPIYMYNEEGQRIFDLEPVDFIESSMHDTLVNPPKGKDINGVPMNIVEVNRKIDYTSSNRQSIYENYLNGKDSSHKVSYKLAGLHIKTKESKPVSEALPDALMIKINEDNQVLIEDGKEVVLPKWIYQNDELASTYGVIVPGPKIIGKGKVVQDSYRFIPIENVFIGNNNEVKESVNIAMAIALRSFNQNKGQRDIVKGIAKSIEEEYGYDFTKMEGLIEYLSLFMQVNRNTSHDNIIESLNKEIRVAGESDKAKRSLYLDFDSDGIIRIYEKEDGSIIKSIASKLKQTEDSLGVRRVKTSKGNLKYIQFEVNSKDAVAEEGAYADKRLRNKYLLKEQLLFTLMNVIYNESTTQVDDDALIKNKQIPILGKEQNQIGTAHVKNVYDYGQFLRNIIYTDFGYVVLNKDKVDSSGKSLRENAYTVFDSVHLDTNSKMVPSKRIAVKAAKPVEDQPITHEEFIDKTIQAANEIGFTNLDIIQNNLDPTNLRDSFVKILQQYLEVYSNEYNQNTDTGKKKINQLKENLRRLYANIRNLNINPNDAESDAVITTEFSSELSSLFGQQIHLQQGDKIGVRIEKDRTVISYTSMNDNLMAFSQMLMQYLFKPSDFKKIDKIIRKHKGKDANVNKERIAVFKKMAYEIANDSNLNNAKYKGFVSELYNEIFNIAKQRLVEVNPSYSIELTDTLEDFLNTLGYVPTNFEGDRIVPLKILDEYVGKIIYASPGAGKYTLAEKIPNVVDFDEIIIDYVWNNIKESGPIKLDNNRVLSTLEDVKKHYGLAVWKNKKTFIPALKEIAKKLKKENKTVLTANFFMAEDHGLIDKAFILSIEESNKRSDKPGSEKELKKRQDAIPKGKKVEMTEDQYIDDMITEEVVIESREEDGDIQGAYNFDAKSNSPKWNSANNELQSHVMSNPKAFTYYKISTGYFNTFKEFIEWLDSKGITIPYGIAMKRADQTMTKDERQSAVDSYIKSVNDINKNDSQNDKDILKQNNLIENKEYGIQELVDKFPLSGVQKIIWNIIKDIANKLNIKITFSLDQMPVALDGIFNPKTGEIIILPKAISSKRIQEVMIHEVVHALTTKIISNVNDGITDGLTQKQINAVKGLNKLYESVKNDNNLQNKYPVKDIFEFIAHLTNDRFVQELESKNKNFLQKIVDFISDIIGISNANELAKKYLKDIISDGVYLEQEGIRYTINPLGSQSDGINIEESQSREEDEKMQDVLFQKSGSLTTISEVKVDNLQSTIEYQLLNEKDEDLDKIIGKSYIYLSEKDAKRFTYLIEKNKEFPKEFKVTKKITRYEKDGKTPLKYNGYNEYIDLYYIKSNKNKNSNLYDIVIKKTGEIVASKVRVLYISKDIKSEIAKKYGLEFTPTKVFSANRSIAFALYRQKPSKAKYIAQAKRYLYDAIKFLNSEETDLKINLDKIEEFLSSFPEDMWDYINTTYSPENSTKINASISLQNEIKFNLPKLGFIQEIEKIVGIKLQGVSFINNDRTGYIAKLFKYSDIKGDWGDIITISNKLTTKQLHAVIEYYLKIKNIIKPTSEEENVRKYAEHRGIDYDELKELVFGNTEKALDNIAYNYTGNSDLMELSKWRESIRNYNWQAVELFNKPYENFQNKVKERITAKFKDKILSNGISHLEYFFNSEMFNWLNINFNSISGEYYIPDMETIADVGVKTKIAGKINPFEMRIYQKPKANKNFLKEKEVFNRLAAILHEPFHALHALSYGTKEELNLRKAFDDLYKTDFGKKMMNEVFGSGYNQSQQISYDTLYKEFTAFATQLMLYPKEWIRSTDLRSNDIYEFIEKIQTLQDKTYEEIIKIQQKIGTVEKTITEEEKIKLSFLEKLYNHVIKALNKIIPLSKKFTSLISDSKLVEKQVIEDVFGTVEETVTKTLKLPKNLKKSKEEFLQAMEELQSAINTLMQIDGKLFSSENITDFFTNNKFNQETIKTEGKEKQKIKNPFKDVAIVDDLFIKNSLSFDFSFESNKVIVRSIDNFIDLNKIVSITNDMIAYTQRSDLSKSKIELAEEYLKDMEYFMDKPKSKRSNLKELKYMINDPYYTFVLRYNLNRTNGKFIIEDSVRNKITKQVNALTARPELSLKQEVKLARLNEDLNMINDPNFNDKVNEARNKFLKQVTQDNAYSFMVTKLASQFNSDMMGIFEIINSLAKNKGINKIVYPSALALYTKPNILFRTLQDGLNENVVADVYDLLVKKEIEHPHLKYLANAIVNENWRSFTPTEIAETITAENIESISDAELLEIRDNNIQVSRSSALSTTYGPNVSNNIMQNVYQLNKTSQVESENFVDNSPCKII